MGKKCRHRKIVVTDDYVRCVSCGKVWVKHQGKEYRDLSMRAGGIVNAG
jgi:ribosomal protein S27E